jgi:hypothetical protein
MPQTKRKSPSTQQKPNNPYDDFKRNPAPLHLPMKKKSQVILRNIEIPIASSSNPLHLLPSLNVVVFLDP